MANGEHETLLMKRMQSWMFFSIKTYERLARSKNHGSALL